MGSCLGCTQSEEGKQNNLVEKDLKEEKKQYNKVKKILFLGSGGSGKSTIFKQLRGIYGKPFNPHERQTFVTHIHEQVITQMKLALDILDEYISGDMDAIIKQNELMYIERKENREENADYDEEEDYEDDMDDNYDDEEYANFSGEVPDLSEQALEAKEYLTSIHYTTYQLNDEIVAALKTLWGEPAIKKMYAIRNITKIEDSSAYFWNKLDMLNDKNYVPDEADILLVRNKTTGATEQKYEVPDGKGSFSIIDVGGQKSERKKWIKCFDSVTAVIFVASLSCYDEVLYEDYSTNSMTDQLQLFDDICNNASLKETSMILFLNKKDLFAEKIRRVPLQRCPSLKDYDGPLKSFDKTTKYIRKAFTSLNNQPERKNIFTHITCATDQDNIQKVFADVQHIVIEASLIQAGLMDWDDNQRYQAPVAQQNNDDAQNHDPETAKKIRETIAMSQRQKALFQSPRFMAMAGSPSSNMSGPNPYHNFREIIKKKSIPQLESVQYGLVLPQYHYNVGHHTKNIVEMKVDPQDYISCSYCWARSMAPPMHSSGAGKPPQAETYVMMNIEPNYRVQSQRVQRKAINLSIVLDVGPSLDQSFTDGENKMAAIKQCMVEVLRKYLQKHDRFGLVIFDMQSKVIQELESVEKLNLNQLVHTIEKEIQCEQQSLESARVDSAGYKAATSLYRKLWTQNKISSEYENRVIMITGSRLTEQTLSEAKKVAVHEQSSKRIHSTFFGISERFSLQRSVMSDIAGCNFFSIESSEQLRDKMVTRFEELVTPLMYDLRLVLNANIDSIWRLNDDRYNEDEYKYSRMKHKQQILHLKTVFATKQKYDEDDENCVQKQYLLLIKLSNDSENAATLQTENAQNLQLTLQHREAESLQNVSHSSTLCLQSNEDDTSSNEEYKEDASMLNGSSSQNSNSCDYYDNNSIRKAVIVSRYISIIREWIQLQKSTINKPRNGLAAEYQHKFKLFAEYFKREAKALGDAELNTELNVLQELL
eukprot:CAMPEP_0197033574 /NCGR_PEP_ID=MMETSP1384-20130603/11951_1 /TAXON_ID=29189 /ORGANISM="Ammonia sp." /LENGTH=992 /DNA_ID=CAMNT_0042463403 /DNA_START=120 /DNA_END=3098 /DNA_ORIENTATION=-